MTIPIAGYGRAAAAYTRAGAAEPAATMPAGKGGSSFAEVLNQTVEQAITAGQSAEKQAVAAVTDSPGGQGLTHLVTAVAEAEATLQTVVAVRERMLEAYKEIMRMTV